MPPGNTPPGIPGTHQPNQVNQPNQINQSNQINQPNQMNQPNPQNEAFMQTARSLASSPNLVQLNHPQQPQPQPTHPPQKQPDRNLATNSVPQAQTNINAATLAAILNLNINPGALQNPGLSKLFQQLKKMNFPNQLQNPGQFNSNQLLPSLLRYQQQNQAQNVNFQQQRPKQPMQHMNMQQIQANGGTISSSASSPSLSALSFGSVQSGGLIQPSQNQAILTPRQLNASKKQKESPKVEVNITTQSLANCLDSCGLSNSYLQKIDRFEVANNVKITPKSITTIAIALYTRMNQVVEQSVKNCHIRLSSNLYLNEHQNFIEKQKSLDPNENLSGQQKLAQTQLQQKMNQEFQKRALSLLPGEPIFTDVPLANIAQIEAERRIIRSGIFNYPEPPKGTDNTFDVYRNHTLCGIAARVPERIREKVTKQTKEIPDNAQPDYSSIARLGFIQTDKKLEVTFEDVYQVIENDVMFTPQKLQSLEFSLQSRKISILQNQQLNEELDENDENENENQ